MDYGSAESSSESRRLYERRNLSSCLVAVGWQSGVALEGAARQGMTIAFALVPAILCLAGMILLLVGFKITKEKVTQYQKEIDAKG